MSSTADFIREARARCAMSIGNTAVGDWLGDALRRLEQSEAENERLRQRATVLTTLCSDRLVQRWDDNAEYRAEIDRLRETLQQTVEQLTAENKRLRDALETITLAQFGTESLEWAKHVAREALKGGGDDE